jgi:hypothetical protein
MPVAAVVAKKEQERLEPAWLEGLAQEDQAEVALVMSMAETAQQVL